MEQVKYDTAVENSAKRYTSPRTTEIFIKEQSIICQSVTGSFGVSDSNVEKGDDSVWGENPGW